MGRYRLPLRSACLFALLSFYPAIASAQLKEAQDRGWSGLKEGYSLVASMADNKSNRTKSNFESAVSKITSSMDTMSPYIDKMGDRVADDDKSYAAGLKNNIRDNWKAVVDANDRLRRAYDAVKDSPEKLAEVNDELVRLKATLMNYESACSVAYSNYKARWDDLKNATEKMDNQFKDASAKTNDLDKQVQNLLREEQALLAELDKTAEERRKLDRASLDAFVLRTSLKEKLYRMRDDKSDEYVRTAADLDKTYDLTLQIIAAQDAAANKDANLEAEFSKKRRERERLVKDTKTAGQQLTAAPPQTRFQKWNEEFPANNYSFQSMK